MKDIKNIEEYVLKFEKLRGDLKGVLDVFNGNVIDSLPKTTYSGWGDDDRKVKIDTGSFKRLIEISNGNIQRLIPQIEQISKYVNEELVYDSQKFVKIVNEFNQVRLLKNAFDKDLVDLGAQLIPVLEKISYKKKDIGEIDKVGLFTISSYGIGIRPRGYTAFKKLENPKQVLFALSNFGDEILSKATNTSTIKSLAPALPYIKQLRGCKEYMFDNTTDSNSTTFFSFKREIPIVKKFYYYNDRRINKCTLNKVMISITDKDQKIKIFTNSIYKQHWSDTTSGIFHIDFQNDSKQFLSLAQLFPEVISLIDSAIVEIKNNLRHNAKLKKEILKSSAKHRVLLNLKSWVDNDEGL